MTTGLPWQCCSTRRRAFRKNGYGLSMRTTGRGEVIAGFVGMYGFDMLPFFLYLVAGAVTGFHVYSLLALTVLGAPSHPLEFVSLLGSLGLVVAAYLSLFKPHAAARLALLASLAIWLFYGPATARAVETRLHKQRSELFLNRTIASPHLPVSTGSPTLRMIKARGGEVLSTTDCHVSRNTASELG